MLLESDPALFRNVTRLRSRAGKPFTLVSPANAASTRAWLRWPLSRLFINRRPTIITNPSSKARGLALPFVLAGAERYVLIVSLRQGRLDKHERTFLEIIQSSAAGAPEARQTARRSSLDSVRIDVPSAHPLIVWCGKERTARKRFTEVVEERGWRVHRMHTLAHVAQLAQRGTVDVVVLQAGQRSVLRIIRAVRQASGAFNVPIILFNGRTLSPECAAIVDATVAPQAEHQEIAAALDAAVELIPARKDQALRARVASVTPSILHSNSYESVAQTVADAAISVGAGWAAVALVDRDGKVFKAEAPQRPELLLKSITSTFLSGYAVVRSNVEEPFFREILDDDESSTDRLKALRPLSGASLPIIHESRIVGTLLTLSTAHRLDEGEANALRELSELAAQAFGKMQRLTPAVKTRLRVIK